MTKKLIFSLLSLALPVFAAYAHCSEEDLAYTGKAAAIEAKKMEMMAAVEDASLYFATSEGESIKVYDPHAYWLGSRILNMYENMVHTSDDCWAWMLACNDFVEEYNRRLGRRLGSAEAAVMAINEIIQVGGSSGSQSEMNGSYYCRSILALYETVHDYHKFINRIGDSDDTSRLLQRHYYCDFQIWYELMETQYDLMRQFTYGAAWYSALPIDWACLYMRWSETRRKGLDVEWPLAWYRLYDEIVSEEKEVPSRKFYKLLDEIGDMTCRDVSKQISKVFYDRDGYDLAYERVSSFYDFDRIDEIVERYRTLMVCWFQLREQIAADMPEDKQNSCRETTKYIAAQLYKDLYELSCPSL